MIESNSKNNWHLHEPHWKTNNIFGEGLFFIKENSADKASCQLLFEPSDSLVITSASRDIIYKIGTDYIVDENTRRVTLPKGSRIPFTLRAELYPEVDDKFSIAHKAGEEKVGLYFSEGHFYHDLQAEASYAHHSFWPYAIPEEQGYLLPKALNLLTTGSSLKICLCGDSISAGSNASKLTGAQPGMPPYADLFVNELKGKFNHQVEFKNFAVGGKRVKHGLQVLEDLIDEKPDLVIIAYGMNDIASSSVEKYLSTVSQIMEDVSSTLPESEFILVASMLGNPEWHCKPSAPFFEFRDALKTLQKEGVAIADLTQVWADLLQLKSYHDLTGNGVNHPNDFGHRVYAQVLLTTMLSESFKLC